MEKTLASFLEISKAINSLLDIDDIVGSQSLIEQLGERTNQV